MYLIKQNNGNYIPFDDHDYEQSKKIPVGGVLKASNERNYEFHKKAFALIKIGYENQKKYASMEIYRKVVSILAGWYDEVQDKNGEPYYLPKSVSFSNMNYEDFERWYNDVINVVAKDLGVTKEELDDNI